MTISEEDAKAAKAILGVFQMADALNTVKALIETYPNDSREAEAYRTLQGAVDLARKCPALAACQAAPVAAGLTAKDVTLLGNVRWALDDTGRWPYLVDELVARLEAAKGEAGNGHLPFEQTSPTSYAVTVTLTGRSGSKRDRPIGVDLTDNTVNAPASGDMTPADARLFVAGILRAVGLAEGEASDGSH